MKPSPECLPVLQITETAAAAPEAKHPRWKGWCLVVAAVTIPASLLWDFSWECTIGIDLPWAPPHVATYAGVTLAGLAALSSFRTCRSRDFGVYVAGLKAPAGAWVVLWGSLAYLAALVFDHWWQSTYGLATGIWHPPQLLKAVAFFAILLGVLIHTAGWAAGRDKNLAFMVTGGAALALTFVVTLTSSLANRQQSAAFYQATSGVYPLVLVGLAAAGKMRFSATGSAMVYTLMIASAVWILPLLPGTPAVSPIYNSRDYLMPPPFPLLLVAPASAIDCLLQPRASGSSTPGWAYAFEAGLAFFLVFMAVQWPFARFLLSPASDNWFFAGGGRQWPFFLNIDPPARTAFWRTPGDELTLMRGLVSLGLAVISARLGLWLAAWLKSVRR